VRRTAGTGTGCGAGAGRGGAGRRRCDHRFRRDSYPEVVVGALRCLVHALPPQAGLVPPHGTRTCRRPSSCSASWWWTTPGTTSCAAPGRLETYAGHTDLAEAELATLLHLNPKDLSIREMLAFRYQWRHRPKKSLDLLPGSKKRMRISVQVLTVFRLRREGMEGYRRLHAPVPDGSGCVRRCVPCWPRSSSMRGVCGKRRSFSPKPYRQFPDSPRPYQQLGELREAHGPARRRGGNLREAFRSFSRQ